MDAYKCSSYCYSHVHPADNAIAILSKPGSHSWHGTTLPSSCRPFPVSERLCTCCTMAPSSRPSTLKAPCTACPLVDGGRGPHRSSLTPTPVSTLCRPLPQCASTCAGLTIVRSPRHMCGRGNGVRGLRNRDCMKIPGDCAACVAREGPLLGVVTQALQGGKWETAGCGRRGEPPLVGQLNGVRNDYRSGGG